MRWPGLVTTDSPLLEYFAEALPGWVVKRLCRQYFTYIWPWSFALILLEKLNEERGDTAQKLQRLMTSTDLSSLLMLEPFTSDT